MARKKPNVVPFIVAAGITWWLIQGIDPMMGFSFGPGPAVAPDHEETYRGWVIRAYGPGSSYSSVGEWAAITDAPDGTGSMMSGYTTQEGAIAAAKSSIDEAIARG